MNKPGENIGPDDIVKVSDVFPEGIDTRNKHLILWNVGENFFDSEVNAYRFIVAALKNGITLEIMERWISYFGEKVILDAFEFHKEKVSETFRNKIKDIISEIN